MGSGALVSVQERNIRHLHEYVQVRLCSLFILSYLIKTLDFFHNSLLSHSFYLNFLLNLTYIEQKKSKVISIIGILDLDPIFLKWIRICATLNWFQIQSK